MGPLGGHREALELGDRIVTASESDHGSNEQSLEDPHGLLRRTASTTATYYKVLKILDGWLAEEEEIPTNPILSADSSPASVNILVSREDLSLQPPDSHTGALSPELQG